MEAYILFEQQLSFNNLDIVFIATFINISIFLVKLPLYPCLFSHLLSLFLLYLSQKEKKRNIFWRVKLRRILLRDVVEIGFRIQSIAHLWPSNKILGFISMATNFPFFFFFFFLLFKSYLFIYLYNFTLKEYIFQLENKRTELYVYFSVN